MELVLKEDNKNKESNLEASKNELGSARDLVHIKGTLYHKREYNLIVATQQYQYATERRFNAADGRLVQQGMLSRLLLEL
jgi:hypothetical protein